MNEQVQAATPPEPTSVAAKILKLIDSTSAAEAQPALPDDTKASIIRSIGVTGTTLFTVDI